MSNQSAAHHPAGPPNLSEALLTADDVAALLSVPRSSVYEYARRRYEPLPSLLIGRHRRFYRSEIEWWLLKQRDQRARDGAVGTA